MYVVFQLYFAIIRLNEYIIQIIMQKGEKVNKGIKTFNLLKLDQKITLFVIIVLAIPSIVFTRVSFNFLEKNRIQSKVEDIKISMTTSKNTIQKSVEMCDLSTQIFKNSKDIIDYVISIKQGEKLKTKELISYYKNVICNMEKIVNSNPYLYKIRMYVNADMQLELMPIIYKYDRLKQLEWAKDGKFESETWQFDYDDTVMPETTSMPKKHIVSLVTRINDYEYGELGVIDIAMKMEHLFPAVYESTYDNWTCFIDSKDKIYFSPDVSGKWEKDIPILLAQIKDQQEQSYYKSMKLQGERVIVACESIKELGGYLIKIVSLEQDAAVISRTKNFFIAILILAFGIITIIISHSIRALLKKLYQVIKSVNLIGAGDLSIRVPVEGHDEVGDLAKQINLMLEYMTKLMEQGIQKERLIKNTEIKALQNQINAHFIYNVLESIKMMAEIKEEYDVSDALTSLGKLLRYTMRWGEQNVTVEDEVEYIRNYLALINLRFDYRIILSINMTQDLLKQQIPKMSLQPIIENAIYHGIEELAEDTTIYIKGIVQDEVNCAIEIMDSGIGMTEEQVINLRKKIAGEIVTSGGSGNGLGLKNVQDRIVMSFGNEYGLSVISKEGCYTKVIVKIPYIISKGGRQ